MHFKLNICFSAAGGIGDNINTSMYLAAIKRKFPLSSITVVCSRFPEVFKGNPVVDKVICKEQLVYQKTVNLLRDSSKYDLFFEKRYAVNITFSARALRIPQVALFKKTWDKKAPKYKYIFDKFLRDIPAMDSLKKPHYEITLESANLDGSTDDMYLSLIKSDYKRVIPYRGLRYVVISNSAANGSQTKSWSLSHWGKVTEYLKELSIIPIQTGVKSDPDIPGAARFFGTLHETACLVKEAKFVICIEGALAHVAKAVGTPAIVLFGPTPVKTFGYDININLRSSTCSPCWWEAGDWMVKCHREGKLVSEDWVPPCMQDLTPNMVIKAVHQMLERKGLKIKAKEPSLDMSENQLKASVFAKEKEILARVQGTSQEALELQYVRLGDNDSPEQALDRQKLFHKTLDAVGCKKRVVVVGTVDDAMLKCLVAQYNRVTILTSSEILRIKAKYLYQCRAVEYFGGFLPMADKVADVVILADNVWEYEHPLLIVVDSYRVLGEGGKLISNKVPPSIRWEMIEIEPKNP